MFVDARPTTLQLCIILYCAMSDVNLMALRGMVSPLI